MSTTLPSRILVCGGRTYRGVHYVHNTLDALVQYFDDEFVIITGGAPGVDAYAFVWAQDKGYPTIVMDASWRFYKKGAGSIRNSWMLKWAAPDLILAFPGGSGTANMVAQGKDAGITVYEV